MEYGLIGKKLSHSYSPEIHRMIQNYSYQLKEIPEEELSSFMKEKNFQAINVTIPYKEKVLPFLDQKDDIVRAIGACNTIINRRGKLFGYNTDYYGLYALIQKVGVNPKGKKVLILGSGGTSKTAKKVFQDLGAREILKVSRSKKEGALSYEEAALKSDIDILINTTPLGMYPETGKLAISLDPFPKLKAVIDCIYHPIRSQLVIEANRRGIRAMGGLYMLVVQAFVASMLFIGKQVSLEKLEKVYQRLVFEKSNLVIIGMPTSGKSLTGKLLAEKLKLPFIDTDCLIEKREGMKIKEIFHHYSNKGFREKEEQAIESIRNLTGHVIATGGGAILRQSNIDVFESNGIFFYLDKSLKKLHPSSSRPLSESKKDLQKLYHERIAIYSYLADYRIQDKRSFQAAEMIAKIYRKACLI